MGGANMSALEYLYLPPSTFSTYAGGGMFAGITTSMNLIIPSTRSDIASIAGGTWSSLFPDAIRITQFIPFIDVGYESAVRAAMQDGDIVNVGLSYTNFDATENSEK